MHCVIGSGPAGVSCAKALLARGAQVLMLDAGIELESDKSSLASKLATVQPSDWIPQDVASLKGGIAADAKGIPLKLLFGSDYPYRETETHIPWVAGGIGVRPSLALGGLSTVWGAAMLPYREQDISDWPIKLKELEQHYAATLEFTGLAAANDDLEDFFPLYADNVKPLPISRQAAALTANLHRHRNTLMQNGWRFGRARLAVRSIDSPRRRSCVSCGLCMYGCPYGCIYNSADTVAEMRTDKAFTYQRDVVVDSVREDSSKVFVSGHHLQTRQPLSFEVDRAYLAAGVMPTTQILLRSKSVYDVPVQMRDCQYFLFPLLLAKRTRNVQQEALYTLSQMFLDFHIPRVSNFTVHFQVYTYSDLIGQAVRKSFGPLSGFLEPLARQLEERLLIFQGFLHSKDSRTIETTLKHDVRNGGDRLHLIPMQNNETRKAVRRALCEVLRQAKNLGGIPLLPMLQVAEPGRSFHCGGTFPMNAEPTEFQSDLLGRPYGWKRVHAVDATVFPTIPATTITFSVMANAHRIGWETANIE